MADEPVRRLDPRQPVIITILGKKRSGKSVLARHLFDTFPFDRIVVDVHAELDSPEAVTFRGECPNRWPPPAHERQRFTTVRFVPDMGAATYRDEMDRAVGLAMKRRRTLVWLDEVGELTNANNTPPHMRRALHQGRHRDLSMLLCGPRAVDINPLVISQADYLHVFELPHPHDRERVAAVIGYPPKDFDAAVHALGEHEYLRWDGTELLHFPPIPIGAQLDREQRFANRD